MLFYDTQTVMAHAVYLSDDEIQTFRDTETGVAHCPNSNMRYMPIIIFNTFQ